MIRIAILAEHFKRDQISIKVKCGTGYSVLTSTVVYQTLSAVEITLYIAPCIAIHALTYDDAPLVVSRYLGHDTIRVSPAQVSRYIDVSLRQ